MIEKIENNSNINRTIITFIEILTLFTLFFTFYMGYSIGYTLWFFLILPYYCLLKLSPKTLKEIIIKSISYPLIFLILFALFQKVNGETILGFEFEMPFTYYLSQHFFPFILSALIIFFSQKHKFKNDTNFSFKHPLLWLAVLSIVIAIIHFNIDKRTTEFLNDYTNKSKIENNVIEDLHKNEQNILFVTDSFYVNLNSKDGDYDGDKSINLQINIKNLYEEVIEFGNITFILELDYNKGKFILNSKYDSKNNGKFIPIINSSPFDFVEEIKNKYNISDYVQGREKAELDSIKFGNLGFHIQLSEYEYYNAINKDFENNKSYPIFKKILDAHSNVWRPNEVKKLQLKWKVGSLLNDSIYKTIPNIDLFKVKRAKAKIYLYTSNSNGFKNNSLLKSIDITNKWNNNFVDEYVTYSKKIESDKNAKNCERQIKYKKSSICLPIYTNWQEVSSFENLNEIQIEGNKIIGFYMNNKQLSNTSNKNILRNDYINLFASQATMDIEANEQSLDLVSDGLKHTFKIIDKLDLDKIIDNKNLYIGVPLLVKEYKTDKNYRTITSIVKFSENDYVFQKLNYLNIINIDGQLLFLNYSVKIEDKIELANMNKKNMEIMSDFLKLNL